MTLFQNKFERHAAIIVSLPILGFLIERLSDINDTVHKLGGILCTILFLTSFMWSTINIYFIYIQKTRWPRKVFWTIVNLLPALVTLTILLSIEFNL